MTSASQLYWRKNLWLLSALLLVWFAVSFGCGILFVEELNRYRIGGFPLGFWFAQQGAIYAFVVLILIYAVLMDRLDKTAPRSAPEESSEDLRS